MSTERPVETSICVCCRRRPVADAWRPFCSERCRLIDLARWADGAYSIPGAQLQEPEGHGPKPGES